MSLISRGSYFHILELVSSKDFQKKHAINLPVDPKINYPNPWSIQSLAFDIASITIRGNYSFPLGNIIGHEEYKKLVEEYSKNNLDDLTDSFLFQADVVSFLYHKDRPPLRLCETKKLVLEVDLEKDIQYLQDIFHQIISSEKRRLKKAGLLKEKKDNPDVQERQIDTVIFRKEGRSFSEIGEITHPEKHRKSPKKAEKAAFDDFKAGFKLFYRRDYNPIKDAEEFKEFLVTTTCTDCETKDHAKYATCIKRVSTTGEWKPLCSDIARSLKKGQKKSLREDSKDTEKLEILNYQYKKGQRLDKQSRRKKNE
jgi:hypothetical protein